MIGRGLALGGVLVVALGCAKKQEAPRRTEPWLASASASPSSAPALREAVAFNFASESRIRFSLTGRKAKLSGQVPLARGTLRLDPRNLESSKASLDADLARITLQLDAAAESALHTDGGSAASADVLALQWLELGSEVAAERRSQFALARFELVSLENLSSTTLDFQAQLRERATVRATAVGTLLLHGYRAPIRAEVTLQTLPPTATGQLRVSIRSIAPFVLPLAPHDIVARGPSGSPQPLQTTRAEGFVGKSVRIELELVAEATN